MEYAEFDAARRRLLAVLGRGGFDAGVLAFEVERLRDQAHAVTGTPDRLKALRYVDVVDSMVGEALGPRYDTLMRADRVMRAAHQAGGDLPSRRDRAQEAIRRIAELAAAAQTDAERGAVLDLNESLVELVAVLDRRIAAGQPGPSSRTDP